jgi:hypothetical protein
MNKPVVVAGVVIAFCLLSGIATLAQSTWVDEINNSLSFSASTYPGSNWEPYHKKLKMVREAVAHNDHQAVKTEMGKWFKMLRQRDYGISDVAADELYNFSLMVTPIQEYGIAVPAGPVGLGDSGY